MLPGKRVRLSYLSPLKQSVQICRRYSAKPDPGAKGEDAAASPETNRDPEDSAIMRRLQSLAETAQPIRDDPKAGAPSATTSSTITDRDILELQERISQARFDSLYPRAQAQVSLPRSADKLTRNIAADIPWTGEESTHDSVLRMLTDVHKPLKMPVPKPTLSSLPLKGPTKKFVPQKGTGRVLAAKEASQGYSLLKEKLSPGFRAMPATMEGLASLAEERIQDARTRGEFKNLPGRGKPAEKDHLNDSAYIDRTEYFLNRILQRQGAAPPWVQAQVDLTSTFAQFRESLRTEWLRHITRQITTSPGNLSSHIATAESYVSRDKAANYKLREYKSDWESREEKFHILAINDLNAKTRSYNTIAPYTARKPYTTLSKELDDCYRDVSSRIVDAIRNRPPPSKGESPVFRGAVGILEDLAGPKKQLHVNREGEFGLMDFFKTFLKREGN